MFIYFCEKCKKFEAFKSKTGNFKCPDCGGEYLALGVTVDEWNEFSNDQMVEAIQKAKTVSVIKKPVLDSDIEVEKEDDIPEKKDREQEKNHNTDKKKPLIIAAVVALVLLCVVAVIYYSANRTAILQKKIDKCISKQEWDDAIAYCENIDDQKQLNELKYKKGMDATKDNLIVAINTLSEVADLYPDAKKKLDELISFQNLHGVYEFESSEDDVPSRRGNIEVSTFLKDGEMIAAYDWSEFGTDGYASGPYRQLAENKDEDRQYNITRIISYQFLPDGRLESVNKSL